MKWRIAVHGAVAIVVLSCSSTSQQVSASSQPVVTVPPLEGLAKFVVANVNPALIPKLLPTIDKTDENISKIAKFRPGLGTMMIHLALRDLPECKAD